MNDGNKGKGRIKSKIVLIVALLGVSGGLYRLIGFRQNIVNLRKNEARLKDMLDDYEKQNK
jgi:hypothetical protein